MVRGKLTVFFDGQFWVAVAEVDDENGYRLGRHLFGAEPSDAEIRDWALAGYRRLPLAPASAAPPPTPPSARRAQREASRATDERGLTTRAQEALKEQLASKKQERRRSRAEREADAERRWQLRADKRKAKHRGR